ncbi:hypothetical protein ABZ297_29240 [Nonomuraea sp. NPDC005983]|uniref:hypothetical protein n=1 Tax=Nonomuraea sp. NPDC005983 TaxID=3155595 RepID=UPI0033A773E8
MSLSDVIRNITKTVTDKDELKTKIKDFPLVVVQTTLSAAGQALLLVDRVKNSIKGLGGKEEQEEEHDSRPAVEQLATPPAEEAKPARKEPVIFAPRPGKGEQSPSAAEQNGTSKTKPDLVIFAPAKPEAAEPAASKPAAPEVAPEPVVAPEVAAEPVVASKPAAEAAEPEPAAAAEPVGVAAPEAAAEPTVAPEAAPAEAAPAPAARPTTKKAAAAAEPTAEAAPAAEAKPKARAAKPKAAPKAAAEVVDAAPGKAGEPAEPLPGYSGMTVASLRARMRGKTAEQIGELLAYEQATTARAEVIRMFENRLAKLQAAE